MGTVIRIVSGAGKGYNRVMAEDLARRDAGTESLNLIEKPAISEYSLYPLVNERKIAANSRIETGRWNPNYICGRVYGLMRRNIRFGQEESAYTGAAWFQGIDRSGWIVALAGSDRDSLAARLDNVIQKIIRREGYLEDEMPINRKVVSGIDNSDGNVVCSLIYAIYTRI